MNKISQYYHLSKPGIVRGNAITASAGYFFAAGAQANLLLWFWVFLGASFVIISACVINNILDKKIDAKMARTKNRALVTGEISTKSAILYAILTIGLGLAILAVKTTLLAAIVAFIGWMLYSWVYTFLKRQTVHGTLIGALPGATPPVIGYVAHTPIIDPIVLSLFAILICWQMVHFYAISIYRHSEYKAAEIPVWSVIYGKKKTRRQIIAYGLLFLPVSLSLWVHPNVSYSYAVVMSIVSLLWLRKILPYPKDSDFDAWAKSVFSFSLLVLLAFSITISLNNFLP
jgi:heme o synthase